MLRGSRRDCQVRIDIGVKNLLTGREGRYGNWIRWKGTDDGERKSKLYTAKAVQQDGTMDHAHGLDG